MTDTEGCVLRCLINTCVSTLIHQRGVFMGCQVQLSAEQPYFRTDKVKAVSLLHIVRAVVYIALSFIVEDVFMTLVWIGLADLFVGWWFWGLMMESW